MTSVILLMLLVQFILMNEYKSEPFQNLSHTSEEMNVGIMK